MTNVPNDTLLDDLLPGHALDALDVTDRAVVKAALRANADARSLLAGYEAVAQQLAFAAPARPAPDYLRDDLKARLAQAAAIRAKAQPALLRRQKMLRTYRVFSVVAALVIIVVGLTLALRTGGALPAGQIYATLEVDGAALRFPLRAGDVTDRVAGELLAAPDGRQAVIAVAALPDITPDQSFQLWVRGVDGSVRSGGLFQAAPEAVTYITVPLLANETLDSVQAVGVSLEPAGGSPYADAPSGPRVFAIPITNPET
jgi:anti-sigma-K factor RskA